MESIQKNYTNLINELPKNVTLVAVSKTHSADKIAAMYDASCRIFGENKAQELVEKYEALP